MSPVTLADYTKLMEEYLEFYQSFLAFQLDKLDIILSNSVSQLDQMVKEEQVYILKAKGLEQSRISLQSKLGLDSHTFDQVIDLVDDSMQKHQLHQIKQKLNNIVLQIQSTNQLSLSHAQFKLNEINDTLSSQPPTPIWAPDTHKSQNQQETKLLNRSI